MRLKTFLPATALLFSVTSLVASDYISISVPESRWINSYGAIGSADETLEAKKGISYSLNEAFCITNADSSLNDNDYLIVDDCKGSHVGLIRDEEGKTFFVARAAKAEVLLYDFTANAGDVIKNVWSKDYNGTSSLENLQVKSVDKVNIGGVERKRLNFEGGSWIEGIGNQKGLFTTVSNDKKRLSELDCMCNNGKTLFPKVKNGACKLPFKMSQEKNKVTNLMGTKSSSDWFVMNFDRKVSDDEIYIINSKGEIVKPYMTVNPDKLLINMSDYAEGNYLLLVRNETTLSMGRMVKI